MKKSTLIIVGRGRSKPPKRVLGEGGEKLPKILSGKERNRGRIRKQGKSEKGRREKRQAK